MAVTEEAAGQRVTARGVMKAVTREGAGPSPGEGDQVLFHFTVREKEGVVLYSTAKEHGGRGYPRRAVLGHSRMIAGLEHGLKSMQPGEAALLKVLPEAHFAAKGCPAAAPELWSKDEELLLEVQLLAVVPGVEVLSKRKEDNKKKKAKKKKGKGKTGAEEPMEEEEEEEEDAAKEGRREEEQPDVMEGAAVAVVESDERLLTKKVVSEGVGWEQPRAPFEVEIRVAASQPPASDPYFSWALGDDGASPLVASMGQSQMPLSLEKGLESMRQEEHAVIYGWEGGAPATSSSSGSRSSSQVPGPLAPGPVEFDVQLQRIVQVRDVLGNGEVFKKRLVDGKGEFPMDCPLEDCVVRLHYRGNLPDEGGLVFIDTREANAGRPVEVATGEGFLPEALETSVRVMLPGETALVTSSAAHAYDTFPRPEKVPPGARVQWEVELMSFDTPKRWEGLSFKEIVAEVERIKELGNGLFKRELYQLARAKYEKMVRELRNVHPQSEEETKELNAVNISLQLNVAACFHKLGEYRQAEEWANKVLGGNPSHPKALFRRAQAHMMAGDYEEGRQDIRKMMKADASTLQEGNSMLARLRKMEEEATQKQRMQFKGLFDKKPGLLSVEEAKEKEAEAEAKEKTRDDVGASNEQKTERSGLEAPDIEPRAESSEFDKEGVKVAQRPSWTNWIPSFMFFGMLAILLLLISKGPLPKHGEL